MQKRDNPYKTARAAFDEQTGSFHAPSRVLRAFLGTCLGCVAGMTGGSLTATAMVFVIAAVHETSGPGTLGLLGGLMGAFTGLLAGMLTGGGLALYISKVPAPDSKRFRMAAVLLYTTIGLIYSLFGILIVIVMENVKADPLFMIATFGLGAVLGTSGAGATGYLLALAMEKIWRFPPPSRARSDSWK